MTPTVGHLVTALSALDPDMVITLGMTDPPTNVDEIVELLCTPSILDSSEGPTP